MKKISLITFISFTILNINCKKQKKGCTDSSAYNYSPEANYNDGSCITKIYGCMDKDSYNYNPNANVNDNSCIYQGSITFYYNQSNPITQVYISNKTGQISQYYSSSIPSCNSTGCASFTLPVGNYTYSAPGTPNNKTGYVTITKNSCILQLLY